MRLEGRRVVLTGASSGIGLAAVRRFAREGADLALLARGREGLEKAAAIAAAEGSRAHVVPVDLGDRPAVEGAIEESAALLGGIDVLVPNAAAAGYGPFEAVPADDFERTVKVNFLGAVDAIRAGLPHLRRSRGGIVATGSIVARVPTPLFSSYVASKGALRTFLISLRSELRADGSGVSVSVVHPGVVDTPFWRNVTSATGLIPRVPPGAYDPEPIARALVDCAVRPRAEVTLGGVALAQVVSFELARPLGERALGLVAAWLRSGTEPAGAPGGLWQSSHDGRAEERAGAGGRPSLLSHALATPEAVARLARRAAGR